MPRALATTLLLFAAVLGAALLRYAPPHPLPATAPASGFSAARAYEAQRAIVGDGRPRGVGTESNQRARDWLEGELAKMGWKTSIQSAMSCTRHGSCARVANVIATREGREPDAAAVLLTAHYDSVPCSPGASDDGMGTAAAMEAARAIAAGPPLRRNVVLVLTDGEEAGLLGADAFVNQHPLATTVRGAVNVDSRGSAGPSAMFETTTGNAWIIGLLARHAERPVTSSLFYEVYRRMPNDTDFTTVKGRVHGVNFANIARVATYHTPLDTLENADLGTLQHHGDQALAMVRALADAGPELDAPRDPARDAVWFDVLASFVVRWPASASLGLSLLALALVAGWTIRLRAWGVGFAAPLAALVAAFVASLVAGGILRHAGALPVPWLAHPVPALFSLHFTSIVVGLGVALFVARRSKASAQVLWAGTWLTWGLLGVATAAVAPGACFLFVVPTFVAGFLGWLRIDLAAAVPALVAAVLWMPLAILVYDGLGLVVPALACISSTVLVTTLPALGAKDGKSTNANANGGALDAKEARRRTRIAGAATVVFGLGMLVAVLVPKFSAESPQRVNVVFRQDDPLDGTTPPARVYVEAAWAYMPWGTPPEAMVRALGDPARVQTGAASPWSSEVPFAEVPRIAMQPPRAFVLASSPSDRGWSVRARFSSPRHVRTLALVLPSDRITTVHVEGQLAMPRNGAVVLRGVPDTGVEVTLEANEQKPVALTVLEIAPGLPPAEAAPIARAVLGARDARAVPTQEGDITIVAAHLEL
jgi:hypothetical protein